MKTICLRISENRSIVRMFAVRARARFSDLSGSRNPAIPTKPRHCSYQWRGFPLRMFGAKRRRGRELPERYTEAKKRAASRRESGGREHKGLGPAVNRKTSWKSSPAFGVRKHDCSLGYSLAHQRDATGHGYLCGSIREIALPSFFFSFVGGKREGGFPIAVCLFHHHENAVPSDSQS